MLSALAFVVLQAPQWIWAPGPGIPDRVLFRRDFNLAVKPQSANLAITCDDAYRLYVNGRPVSEHASWYTMQDVDLKPYVHAGRNVLAVEGRNIQSVAGLMVIGEVHVGKAAVRLDSGSDWKFSLKEDIGWREANFDDSKWGDAAEIGPLGIAPWGKPTDLGEVLQEMLSIAPVHGETRHAASPFSPDPAQGYVWPKSMTTVKAPFEQMRIPPVGGGRRKVGAPGAYSYDFGREIAGWIEVDVLGKSKPDLTIMDGEAEDRQLTEPQSVEGGNGHWVFRILPKEGFTGFRFSRIQVKRIRTPIRMKVDAIYRVKPVDYLGSFDCSDNLLNRIWAIGAYTVRLNLDPVAIGAILVPDRGDRFPWLGDDRVSHHTLFDCFGGYDFAKADLDFFVKPGQKPIDINGIPGYTLDWVIALYDYWMYSGDASEIRKHEDDIRTILAEYDSTDTPKGWMFTDWEANLDSTSDKSVVAYHIKYVHAAMDAEKMERALGDKQDAAVFHDDAKRRLAFLKQRRDWPNALPQHATADAVLAGLADNYPGSLGVTTTTPYFTYYLLEALANVHQDQRALDALRKYWGDMIALGATSTWEDLLPNWPKIVKSHMQPPDTNGSMVSLAHPWSSGATAWLTDHVLGVAPVSPGFATCQVKPFLGHLSYAKGSVPTPHGVLHVAWQRSGDGVKLAIDSPPGVSVQVILPNGLNFSEDGGSPKPIPPDGIVFGSGAHSIFAKPE